MINDCFRANNIFEDLCSFPVSCELDICRLFVLERCVVRNAVAFSGLSSPPPPIGVRGKKPADILERDQFCPLLREGVG